MNKLYREEFWSNTDSSFYGRIFDYLENNQIKPEDINSKTFDDFLLTVKNIMSFSTIDKWIHCFRRVVKHICTKNNMSVTQIEFIKDLKVYIDVDKLIAKTPTIEQLNELKEIMLIHLRDKTYNLRDRVIIDLAQYGLSNSEIRFLQEKDIEFIDDNTIKIHLPKRKVRPYVIIDDENVIDDIKQCITKFNRNQQIAVEKDGNIDLRELKETPYLIKASITINEQGKDYVSNPQLIMQNSLKQFFDGDEFGELDLRHLSIEDIRRAMIIYYVLKGTDHTIIQEMYYEKTVNNPITDYKKLAELLVESGRWGGVK